MLKNTLFLKYQKIGSIICVVLAIILIFCGWFYEKKGEMTTNDKNGKMIGDSNNGGSNSEDIFN